MRVRADRIPTTRADRTLARGGSTLLAPNAFGLAESQLFDEAGLIGRATQNLALRRHA